MDMYRQSKREVANSNERRRMENINAGFERLRSLIPALDREKISKAAILQRSCDYIEAVQTSLRQLQDQVVNQRSLIDRLKNALSDDKQSLCLAADCVDLPMITNVPLLPQPIATTSTLAQEHGHQGQHSPQHSSTNHSMHHGGRSSTSTTANRPHNHEQQQQQQHQHSHNSGSSTGGQRDATSAPDHDNHCAETSRSSDVLRVLPRRKRAHLHLRSLSGEDDIDDEDYHIDEDDQSDSYHIDDDDLDETSERSEKHSNESTPTEKARKKIRTEQHRTGATVHVTAVSSMRATTQPNQYVAVEAQQRQRQQSPKQGVTGSPLTPQQQQPQSQVQVPPKPQPIVEPPRIFSSPPTLAVNSLNATNGGIPGVPYGVAANSYGAMMMPSTEWAPSDALTSASVPTYCPPGFPTTPQHMFSHYQEIHHQQLQMQQQQLQMQQQQHQSLQLAPQHQLQLQQQQQQQQKQHQSPHHQLHLQRQGQHLPLSSHDSSLPPLAHPASLPVPSFYNSVNPYS